jgi:hypothetical protein
MVLDKLETTFCGLVPALSNSLICARICAVAGSLLVVSLAEVVTEPLVSADEVVPDPCEFVEGALVLVWLDADVLTFELPAVVGDELAVVLVLLVVLDEDAFVVVLEDDVFVVFEPDEDAPDVEFRTSMNPPCESLEFD